MQHELKTWPGYIGDIRAGNKRFELRKDDRDYQVGDALWLREWDPVTGAYTHDYVNARVTYVLRDAEAFGLMDGFVILGIGDIA